MSVSRPCRSLREQVFLRNNFSRVIWEMPWPLGSSREQVRCREIPWRAKSWEDCEGKYFLSYKLDKIHHPDLIRLFGFKGVCFIAQRDSPKHRKPDYGLWTPHRPS